MNTKNNAEGLTLLKQLFENLPEDSQDNFLDYVRSIKKNEQNKAIDFHEVIKPRMVAVCPHCGSTHFVKNGTKNGSQRYLCRECKKSFVESSGTVLFHTQKDLSVWKKYVHCMIEKYPLIKCAKICGIGKNTAFIWRHKILDALQ